MCALFTTGKAQPRPPIGGGGEMVCRNAANDSIFLAPGSIARCSGPSLPLRSTGTPINEPPYELNGVRVTVNRVPARIRYVGPDSLLIIVPDALPVGDDMQWFRIIFTIGGRDRFSQSPFYITAPGLYLQDGEPQGFIQTPDHRVFVIGDEPIPPGSHVVLVGTGMRYASQVVVNLGLDWIPVTVSPFPSFAGMDTFGFDLPEWVYGTVAIKVLADGHESNTVILGGIQ